MTKPSTKDKAEGRVEKAAGPFVNWMSNCDQTRERY